MARLLVSAAVVSAVVVTSAVPTPSQQLRTAAELATPEQFAGHRIGADNKLVRWDKIVEYMQKVANASDRVRHRELGTSTNGHPCIALEISAPDTLKNLDRFQTPGRPNERLGLLDPAILSVAG